VIRALETLEFHPSVTFLVGENGSGKSTLLEAIAVACGFNAEGGTRAFNFATRASHSSLHEYLHVIRGSRMPRDGFFLRAESLFNVATQVEQLGVTGYGDRSLHEQSHGESFMSLMTNRFTGDGLYLMDEPEAALSPSRQMSLLTIIHRFVRRGSQLVVATHSPILMAYPDAHLYELSDRGIERVEYRDTDHYRLTRAFLDDPPAFLRHLFA
jgi:predicted ATPase